MTEGSPCRRRHAAGPRTELTPQTRTEVTTVRTLIIAAALLSAAVCGAAAHAQQPPVPPAFDTAYVVVLDANPESRAPEAERRATLERHSAYQFRLIADGHTILGGPLAPEPDAPFTGITVLRAPTRAAADRMAAEEPAVQAGLLLATVRTCTTVRSSPAERAAADTITAMVLEFFRAIAAADVEASRRVVHPEAVRFATGFRPAGPWLSRETGEAYLERLGRRADRMHEEIHDVHVHVRRTVASAWAPYDFYVAGEFSHCGTSAITLLRTADGWRIASSARTVEPDGCLPASCPRP
jgi:uncharacterized protein YciI/ketosteroid isomerase-like protein